MSDDIRQLMALLNTLEEKNLNEDLEEATLDEAGSKKIEDENFQFMYDILEKEGNLKREDIKGLVELHGPSYPRGSGDDATKNRALFTGLMRMYMMMHGMLPDDVIDETGFYLSADNKENAPIKTYVAWADRHGIDAAANLASAKVENERRKAKLDLHAEPYRDESKKLISVISKAKKDTPFKYDFDAIKRDKESLFAALRDGKSVEDIMAPYEKTSHTKTELKKMKKADRNRQKEESKPVEESAMSDLYSDCFFKIEDALEGAFFDITRKAEFEATLDTMSVERLALQLIEDNDGESDIEQIIRQAAPGVINIKGENSFGRFDHIYDQYASTAAEEVEYILNENDFVSDAKYGDEELQQEVDDMRARAPSRTIPEGADDEIEESNLSALDRLMWAHSKEVGSGGPKDMRSRHKGYDTETLNKLRSDSVNRDGNSPASLQQRMIDHELRMRGKMKDENDVNEELKRIMELAGQKLDEYDKKLPARNFEPSEEDYPEDEKKKEIGAWTKSALVSGHNIYDNDAECPNCGASGDTIKFDKFTDNQCYCVGCDTKFKQIDDGWDFDKQEDWDEESKYTHYDDPRRETLSYDYEGWHDDAWHDNGVDDDDEEKQSEFKFESAIARLKQLSGIVTETTEGVDLSSMSDEEIEQGKEYRKGSYRQSLRDKIKDLQQKKLDFYNGKIKVDGVSHPGFVARDDIPTLSPERKQALEIYNKLASELSDLRTQEFNWPSHKVDGVSYEELSAEQNKRRQAATAKHQAEQHLQPKDQYDLAKAMGYGTGRYQGD